MMPDYKMILLLALVVLGLVVVLAHRQLTQKEEPLRVEYRFMNLNL